MEMNEDEKGCPTEPVAQIGKLAAALAKAQMEISAPSRNREVRVKTKAGPTYTFKYATLDSIIEAVREPLTKNDLWFTQIIEGDGNGKYRLVTRLIHASGQMLDSTTPLLVAGTGNQEFGSALSYMRRYALTALLGVAADEDDDANAADGNTVETSTAAGRKVSAKRATPSANGASDSPSAEWLRNSITIVQGAEDLDKLAGWWRTNLAHIKALPKEDAASLTAAKDNRKTELESPNVR